MFSYFQRDNRKKENKKDRKTIHLLRSSQQKIVENVDRYFLFLFSFFSASFSLLSTKSFAFNVRNSVIDAGLNRKGDGEKEAWPRSNFSLWNADDEENFEIIELKISRSHLEFILRSTSTATATEKKWNEVLRFFLLLSFQWYFLLLNYCLLGRFIIQAFSLHVSYPSFLEGILVEL